MQGQSFWKANEVQELVDSTKSRIFKCLYNTTVSVEPERGIQGTSGAFYWLQDECFYDVGGLSRIVETAEKDGIYDTETKLIRHLNNTKMWQHYCSAKEQMDNAIDKLLN